MMKRISGIMDQDLVEEIEYLIEVLTKSGFFNIDEIQEILEDQFIEEDIDFSQFNISLNDFDNVNFNKLECAFNSLVEKDILVVHNCGFDIEEGVADAFELQVHLLNNKFNPVGFCFYTFEDVEEAIWDNKLKITFSDFENNEKKALEIGEIAAESLKSEGFSIIWDGTVNSQIEINPFKWDKSFDSEKEYEIEGAYECFINKDVLK
jgi:hypothetical protein